MRLHCQTNLCTIPGE
uniref:Uncharacterized protein n=1 Tax=Anguilla anguilla TaxID=7936 RepID=A0A0E9PMD1_ANGAN